MTNTNCQVTDGVSQISLNVLDCSNPPPLSTHILNFNANVSNGRANLYWTTNHEDEPVSFEIEKSSDGIKFLKIGSVNGLHSLAETNRYSYADSLLTPKAYYRISMINTAGYRTYSRVIQLQTTNAFTVSNVTNYFESSISLDVNVTKNSQVNLILLNSSGNVMRTMAVNAYAGTNNLIIPSLTTLSPGVYILQVSNNEKTATVKVVKK
jgi:hypothetical protein